MRVRVLGSAAGGGFPQWNCSCHNCAAVRRGEPGWRARTQDSIAIFGDAGAVICNASPEIARQIEACPALQPRRRRDTPISAIVLTNGDLDHVLGLFSLRELQPLAVYATETVRRGLVGHNAICAALDRRPGQIAWRTLALDRETALVDCAGRPIGLVANAIAVPGKPPAFLRDAVPSLEDNIALEVRCVRTGARVVYAPNAAAPCDGLGDGADLLLFDGTFWSSDELICAEVSTARAEEMAHVPVARSVSGMRSSCRRKLYTHVNNTNPLLDERSAERRQVERAGWQVAEDGMELEIAP